MPDQTDIIHQQHLLILARRNVRHLLQQVRSCGGINKTPLSTLNDLEDNRAEIARIKDILRRWGVQVDDHPDDREQAAAPRQPERAPQADQDAPPRGQSPSTESPELPVDWPSSTKPFYLDLGWWTSLAEKMWTNFGERIWINVSNFSWGAKIAIITAIAMLLFIVKAQRSNSATSRPLRVSLVHTLPGHTAAIWGARFNPEDNTAFTSGKDGLILRWSTQSGREIGRYGDNPPDAVEVGGVAISPDGTLVAGAFILDGSNEHGEGFVQVYQVADSEPLYTFTGHTSFVWAVDFSPDGKLLASSGEDGTIRLWNMEDGSPGPILRGHTKLVTAMAFSPNGQRLASVSKDGSLQLWDVASGDRLNKAPIDNTYAVDWTPDSEYVASTSGDQSIHIIDADTATTVRTIKMLDYSYALAISPNGQLIAGGCHGTAVCLWDFQTGTQLAEFGKNTPNVIAWNADGTLLIEGGNNQQARIWSVEY
jgi:WD40 repeat protein